MSELLRPWKDSYPPVIDQIHGRLIGNIVAKRKLAHPEARTGRPEFKAAAGEEVLDPQNPADRLTLDTTLINMNRLQAWLQLRGTRTGFGRIYREPDLQIESDLPVYSAAYRQELLRIVAIRVFNTRFELHAALNLDGSLLINLDYRHRFKGTPVKYRRTRETIEKLTPPDAYIINFFAERFLDGRRKQPPLQ